MPHPNHDTSRSGHSGFTQRRIPGEYLEPKSDLRLTECVLEGTSIGERLDGRSEKTRWLDLGQEREVSTRVGRVGLGSLYWLSLIDSATWYRLSPFINRIA